MSDLVRFMISSSDDDAVEFKQWKNYAIFTIIINNLARNSLILHQTLTINTENEN